MTTRRQFLKGAALTACVSSTIGSRAFALGPDLKPKPYVGFLPICQHMTNNSTTQFSVMRDKTQKYDYRITNSQAQTLSYLLVDSQSRPYIDFQIDRLFVAGLNLGETYTLSVLDLNSGKVIDERFFKALDLNKKDIRFALGSCSNDNSDYLETGIWHTLMEQGPEMVIFSGDMTYADQGADGKIEGIWRRYGEARRRLYYFRQKQLIPTLTTWDDHDTGMNDCDKGFALLPETTALYKLFWGNAQAEGLYQGLGTSQILTAFGQRFVFMDDRSWRDVPWENNARHWGEAQENFLYEKLSENNIPAWIINGSQVFGGYLQADSFENMHNKNFWEVMGQLKKIEAPLIFCSGDIHYSEIMRIEPEIFGYETFELTASCIHSRNIIGMEYYKKNWRRINATSRYNFMIIESTADTQKNAIHFKMFCIARYHHLSFSHSGVVKR